MLQGHVFCSSERQPVCAVMVDQLRDTGEDTATLIQGEAQAFNALSLGHNDVHTALTGPDGTRHKNNRRVRRDRHTTIATVKSYKMLKN